MNIILNQLPNLEALKQYTELGIGLAGVTDFGEYVGENENRFTTDFNLIKDLINGKAFKIPITRFKFLPSEKGFVCIDLDEEKSSQVNIDIFRAMANNAGLNLDGIFNKTTFAKTPSGYHFYFKSSYAGRFKKEFARGINMRAGKLNLTAAGSVKNNKLYELKGELKNALPLPEKLLNLIKVYFTAKEPIYLNPEDCPKSKLVINF